MGQNFAMNEERVLASIVRRFRLSLVKGHWVENVPKRTKDDSSGTRFDRSALAHHVFTYTTPRKLALKHIAVQSTRSLPDY